MLLLITIAVLPALLLLAFMGWKDRQHPEPISALVKGLCFGAISIIISLSITSMFEDFEDPILDAFFNAAIPEEFAKLLMFWLLIRKNKNFDEPIDSIVYAVYVSLGFAAVENIMYLVDEEDFFSTAFSRGIFSVPGHFCFAVCMGFCYGMARFGQKMKAIYYPMALIGPILLHGIYDGLLMSMGDDDSWIILMLVWLVFCIIMYRAAIKRINKLREIGVEKKDNNNPQS